MGLYDKALRFLGVKKKEKEPLTVPKTVQQSIPYLGAFENGIIQVDRRFFSKMYTLNEMNFTIESNDEQRNIFGKYMEFLGGFGPEIRIQIIIYNKSINSVEFEQKVLFPNKNDDLNEYREEMNDMLIEKLAVARNNIVHEKYVIFSTEADDIEMAKGTFATIDGEVAKAGQRLTKAEFVPIPIIKRLEIMNSIYKMESQMPLNQQIVMKGGRVSDSFSLRDLKKQGITTKDAIGPSGMCFEYDHFRLGNTYARSLMLWNLPSWIRGDILTELTKTPFNMLTSVHYQSKPQDEAIKLIREKTVDINSNVVDLQKRASKNGYSAELISPEIKASHEEVEQLMEDITSDNQKLFMVTIVITVFADSKEQLDKNTKIIQSTAERFICQAPVLNAQQELGFNSCLPLGKNFLKIERMLNTKASAIFLPFNVKELMQDGGIYYGLNAVSKQLILYSRLSAKNGNGCILGTPGSGKSFQAKKEMISVLLNTGDDVFVIDPENEYERLARLFHGSVIRIAPGSGVHINPLDMDLDYSDEDDPVTLKADFISSICEAAASSRYPLSPIMKSVIDRCVKNIYSDYVETLRQQGKTFDKNLVPTLGSLYEELQRQPEPEAQNMALTLERYVDGTLDSFSTKTNVNIDNRFVVYNIKDIGSGMKNIGLQICLDNIWNKMISNFKKGKRTWLYCDEFHLLGQTETSAKYTQQIWKRARKWNGIPTGITQQVEDMLKTEESRAIISNCDFVVMLNLDPYGRTQMQRMFGISNTELEYITNAQKGQGLIYTGSDIIPFVDAFPKDTKLYQAMTTDPNEVVNME